MELIINIGDVIPSNPNIVADYIAQYMIRRIATLLKHHLSRMPSNAKNLTRIIDRSKSGFLTPATKYGLIFGIYELCSENFGKTCQTIGHYLNPILKFVRFEMFTRKSINIDNPLAAASKK